MFSSSKITNLAKEIFEEILNLTEDKINLNEYCTTKLKSSFPELSDLEICEILDKLVKKISVHIIRRKEECESRNITPEYIIYPPIPYILIRPGLLQKEEPLISFLQKHRNYLLKAMKEMPWEDFEYLCLHILEINEIIMFSPTEKNQKGIDFCALLELDRYSPPGILLKGCRVKIVGQAKRFSREKIGEGLVRNFKTFLEDIQEPKRDVIKKLPKWFKEIKSPILGIFLTTSKFTKGAIKYAQKEGIILKDGEQILEDLIKSPDSGKWVSTVENGKFIFNKNAFFDFFKILGRRYYDSKNLSKTG